MIQPKGKEKLRNSFLERGRQSCLDRRSGEDRRKIYSLDYFIRGGKERRRENERRHNGERRTEWIRINKWYSIFNDSN